MAHDFERATGPWHVEWAAVPESFALTSGALTQATFLLTGLEVDPARMWENIGISRGSIVAEAVMMALTPTIGRQLAHDIVYAACREASERGMSLLEVLADDHRVSVHLGAERLKSLTDPASYLGAARQMVDRILDRKARAASSPMACPRP
jgi:3-carboxy-cis,cis-muconate cycloisomerase